MVAEGGAVTRYVITVLWRAYVLAACNLHVLLPGKTLPPLPTEEEFRELIG
jgi:hypothetical protein